MSQTLVKLAAANNADWYAMMFEIHGLRYERSEFAFMAIDPPPAYHSWVTVLDPSPPRELILRDKAKANFGVKDGFNNLNLGHEGLVLLFQASWIYAEHVHACETQGWQQITTPSQLVRWEAAWNANGSPSSSRQFPDEILGRAEVTIWGRQIQEGEEQEGKEQECEEQEGFDAGVIANRSSECIGMTNCFGRDAIPAASALCARAFPGKPVVGYERGAELDLALRSGFRRIGDLSIWQLSR